MKPLLAQQAPRLDPDGSNAIREWESSADQLTDHGRSEFAKRQELRRVAAQTKPANVRAIKRLKAEA